MQNIFPVHKLLIEQLPFPRGVLDELRPLPQQIYLQGRPESLELLRRLPHDGLAVVGTRIPDPAALKWSRSVIHGLRGTKRIIVSGFAMGVDGMAHEAALEAELPTVAVLGTPLDRDYPARHWGLRQRLLEQGGMLWSEFEPGTEILPHHFALRNRWIAALARATWVVQAPEESGALVTAEWAQALGRDIYVTPAAPWEVKHRGNHGLLSAGATPIQGVEDLAHTWPEMIGGQQMELSSPQRALFLEWILHQKGGVTEAELQNWAHLHRVPLQQWWNWLESAILAGQIFSVEDRWLACGTKKEIAVPEGLSTRLSEQSLLKTLSNSD